MQQMHRQGCGARLSFDIDVFQPLETSAAAAAAATPAGV